ncbi:MAG: MFS transporter [Acidimicrobiales bacterium]|nr:MFS transporter [Acidimicrobiales bacterium]
MPSPARELLADRDFRGFWLAQTCLAGIGGTMRFTFVWLVVTLTDWTAAEGIVAGLLGLPAMLFSAAAGAWSDRVDRKRLFTTWTTVTVVLLTAFTIMISLGEVTPLVTSIAALLIGTAVMVNPPNVNAMVPLLVGPTRLINAIALQNGAMNAANFVAVIFAGVAIEFFGDFGGFALLTVLAVLSLVFMRPVVIPAPDIGVPTESFMRSLRTGLRYTWSTEPVRTMVLLSLVLGSSFSVMQINMPRVVESDFGREAASAGAVMGAFGVGMMISSLLVANRPLARHGLNVAIFIGVGLGGGQFALSLARSWRVAIVVMLLWGVNAGLAMASHRTILQQATAPEMMGRVMGLMMTGFMGGLPIGAAVSSVLSVWFGPADTMTAVGLCTIAIAVALSWRPSIVRLI